MWVSYYYLRWFHCIHLILQIGSILGIPYNESLIGITVFVSIIDSNHDLSEDVGESIIRPLKSDERFHDLDHVPIDCSADITRNRGREKVGKIVYKISRVSVFADRSLHSEGIKKNTDKREELNILSALPDFRFNRLAKPIHWERLKGLNLARSVQLFLTLNNPKFSVWRSITVMHFANECLERNET
jgi:hypothetical protein